MIQTGLEMRGLLELRLIVLLASRDSPSAGDRGGNIGTCMQLEPVITDGEIIGVWIKSLREVHR